MKPAPFKYIRPRSLAEALAAKQQYGDDARFLAGGQSLVPVMNFRLAQPAVLIDLNAVPDLSGITRRDGALHVGAMTRYATMARDATLTAAQPLIAEALPHIAHPQIRNRGTIGGNLAHADPASELPSIVLTLGARLRLQSAKGERWIAANDFFVDALVNAAETNEMLVEIALPDLPPRSGCCFLEVARRRGDFALMGVAAVVTLDAGGNCIESRLGYCNAGSTPMLAPQAAASLAGRTLDAEAFAEAAALAADEIEPAGNVHAGIAYQRHLAGVLTRRALASATSRAREAAV